GERALCRALGLDEDSPVGTIVAELRAMAASGEPVGQRLAEFSEWLALGLGNVVNLLCPQLVVLGDLLAALPPQLVEQVERVVRERSLVSRALGGTRVVTSSLGTDAKLLGDAGLAFAAVLADW